MNLKTGLRPTVFAVLAGALSGFGQAPYDQPVVLFLGLVIVVYLAQKRETAWQVAFTGWAFGLGYFMHSLQWIVSPFMVDVARHGWMAPFALVFLAAGMALFWGAAFWAARRLSAVALWPLVLTWSAVELIRAYIFTGFPWAMPAQALVDVQAGQLLAWGGPYVLNAALVLFAVMAASMIRPALPLGQALFRGGCVVLCLVGLVMPVRMPEAELGRHSIRLVQPNATQRDKWNPEKMPVFFDRQLRFTAEPALSDSKAPELVLWPETAIPWLLDLAGPALVEIAAAGGEAQVALGLQRRDGFGYFNSMAVLERDGSIGQVYDKHHLVPFGEYMPFADVMARFNVFGLAQQAGRGYLAGPGPELLDFGALGKALPLICYEAVFAHDVTAAPERPDFMIQITNDAWFGKQAGPRQHLAQARMRAIEQRLPLARTANTGISAMIDPYGRVLVSLPLNTAGFVDAALPLPLPASLYSRTGDRPLAILLLLGLFLYAWRSREV